MKSKSGFSGRLPRQPHPPEHNIIQRPQLMKRVADFLGMRQAHILPTLNEGVTACLIIGDTSDERSKLIRSYAAAGEASGGDGLTKTSCLVLLNPASSGVVVKNVHAHYCFDPVSAGSIVVVGVGTFTSLPAGVAPINKQFQALDTNADALQPSATAGGGQAVPLFNLAWYEHYANPIVHFPLPDIHLVEGKAVVVQCTSPLAAEKLIGGFRWTEEPA